MTSPPTNPRVRAAQLDHLVGFQGLVRVDDHAVLAGQPVDGRPDDLRQVFDDRVAAHRAAVEPPLAGVLDHADDAVRPRLGRAGVHVEHPHVVAEQRGERRRDQFLVLGHDVRRDRLLRPPVREQPVQVRVLLDDGEERVEGHPDPRHRRELGVDRRDQPLEEDLRAALPEGDVEVGLVVEVPVQHGFRDAGLRGDVLHAEVGAVRVERPERGFDELLAPRDPVLAPAVAPGVAGRLLVARRVLGRLAGALDTFDHERDATRGNCYLKLHVSEGVGRQ